MMETFRLHAWGTSGDIWQMGRPMKEPVTPEEVKMDDFIQWKQSGIEGSVNPGEYFCRDTGDFFWMILKGQNEEAIRERLYE